MGAPGETTLPANYGLDATCRGWFCNYDCYGCIDPNACNYDPTSTDDDGSCEYLTCAGCTDDFACNYD